jgi:hypothetical protein
MKQRIRLTESDLHRIVEESIANVLSENEMEEGRFVDKLNQAKSAATTALRKGNGSLGQRFQNAGSALFNRGSGGREGRN